MRIPSIGKVFPLLSFVIALTGCENALYFYETEKISLTMEARPDSTQPVQGSLGLKQRVVLVTPPKDEASVFANGNQTVPVSPLAVPSQIQPKINLGCDETSGNVSDVNSNVNDALSAISSFSFDIIPIDWEFNPVMIRTAFITGEAATQLNTCEAARAAQAIKVGMVETVGANISMMRNAVASMRDSLKRSWSEQDKQQLKLLNDLGKGVLPENYPVPIFKTDSALTILSKDKSEGEAVNNSDIDSALTYWAQLESSAKVLKDVLDAPEQYQYNNIPASDDLAKAGLRNFYEQTEQELKRVGQELAGNPVYMDAVQYYVDKFIKNSQGE